MGWSQDRASWLSKDRSFTNPSSLSWPSPAPCVLILSTPNPVMHPAVCPLPALGPGEKSYTRNGVGFTKQWSPPIASPISDGNYTRAPHLQDKRGGWGERGSRMIKQHLPRPSCGAQLMYFTGCCHFSEIAPGLGVMLVIKLCPGLINY